MCLNTSSDLHEVLRRTTPRQPVRRTTPRQPVRRTLQQPVRRTPPQPIGRTPPQPIRRTPPQHIRRTPPQHIRRTPPQPIGHNVYANSPPGSVTNKLFFDAHTCPCNCCCFRNVTSYSNSL